MYNPLFGIIALLAAFAVVGGIALIVTYFEKQKKLKSDDFSIEQMHAVEGALKMCDTMVCANKLGQITGFSNQVLSSVLSALHADGKVIKSPHQLNDGRCDMAGACKCIQTSPGQRFKYKIKDQV